MGRRDHHGMDLEDLHLEGHYALGDRRDHRLEDHHRVGHYASEDHLAGHRDRRLEMDLEDRHRVGHYVLVDRLGRRCEMGLGDRLPLKGQVGLLLQEVR